VLLHAGKAVGDTGPMAETLLNAGFAAS
jgi:hypothetical protein